MRQIFLDTETTGLDPKNGHRVIEIGAVEVANRKVTDRHFHVYLQPDRAIDPEAQKVHGITLEFLEDKPRFSEIAQSFLAFIEGAELLIHNAPFDLGFLNAELARVSLGMVQARCQIVDTLKMARELFPGKANNLNALCKRYDIATDHRVFHGALLDTELLAEVYLAMTRGQHSLIDDGQTEKTPVRLEKTLSSPKRDRHLSVLTPSEEECAAHEALLQAINKESKGRCVWQKQLV